MGDDPVHLYLYPCCHRHQLHHVPIRKDENLPCFMRCRGESILCNQVILYTLYTSLL